MSSGKFPKIRIIESSLIFPNGYFNISIEAFVTLATNDNYAIGAMVLASSLRKVGTQKHLFILITDNVSDKIRFDFFFI